jgi:hypothetical protein
MFASTRSLRGFVSLAAVLVSLAGNAGAQTPTYQLQLSPQDTSLNVDAANYSAQPLLTAYTWPDNQIANAILLKFDLSSLPAGATIQQAVVSLALVQSDGTADATYTMTALKLLGKNPVIAAATGYTFDGVTPWTPSTCCYNGVPLAQADVSTPYALLAVDKTAGFKQWTITTMVKEWFASPASNFGLVLNSDATVARDRYRYFASTKYADATLRPALLITYSLPAVDTTPPTISTVASSSITGSAATIGWSTNEVADSQVEYGLTTAYGGMTSVSASLVTAHRLQLSGLSNAHTYHYRVRSRDAAANLAVSGDFTFTTLDKTSPAVSVSSPVAGTTVRGLVTVSAQASDNVGVASVQLQLDGVNLGAKVTTPPYAVSWNTTTATTGSHSLRAVAKDAAGNSRTSTAISVIVSNDTTPPVISGMAVTAITPLAATIVWTTNEASDSQVDYGLTTTYGSSSVLSAAVVTVHTALLSGLTAGTTYHARVRSRDAAGNLAVSADVAFATSGIVPPPPPPPSGWPHEPAGFAAWTTSSLDLFSGNGWDIVNPSGDATIVANAGASLTPTHAGQWQYPSGFGGGYAPATMYHALPPAFDEGFVGVMWKPSNPWQGHSTNVNKIFFLLGGACGNLIPIMYGPPGGPYQLRVAPEWGNWSWLTPNVNDVPIVLGSWHRIELYFKYNTPGSGIVRWWMDGTLIGDYTNVTFPSSGCFAEFQLSPTWGGVGDVKKETDYFWFDDVYISLRQ